jgi:hypothetical protein
MSYLQAFREGKAEKKITQIVTDSINTNSSSTSISRTDNIEFPITKKEFNKIFSVDVDFNFRELNTHERKIYENCVSGKYITESLLPETYKVICAHLFYYLDGINLSEGCVECYFEYNYNCYECSMKKLESIDIGMNILDYICQLKSRVKEVRSKK